MDVPLPVAAYTQRFGKLGRAHTKIVATIGPASEDRLDELIDAGLSVARINFSHGSLDEQRRRVHLARAAAARKEVALGVLADLRGPKMRMGVVPGGKLLLEDDARIRLVEGAGPAAPGELPIDVPGLAGALEPGQRVCLADGAVELVVEESAGRECLARVTRGGVVGDRKGVHLPDSALQLSVPTPQDLADLELASELDLDMIGVSFASHPDQLREVRRRVPGALIVAKIERAAALDNLDGLLSEADGIMVARGDLGVEVELEQLPMVQKSLIQAALRAGKFTITATEMLESMVGSSRPTRAEVADVANAVLDGTDAVMLSAETAVGQHPVEAVSMMSRIARAVEASQRYSDLPRVSFRASEPTFSNAAALAAAQAAEALGLSKIIVFTETGNTVRLLSRYRPTAEVVALTPHRRTLNHMAVLAHVRPVMIHNTETLEGMLEAASRLLVERRWLQLGEQVVFVAGVPPGIARTTNVMKLHRIGDPIKF
jgi:pyruvate kinase